MVGNLKVGTRMVVEIPKAESQMVVENLRVVGTKEVWDCYQQAEDWVVGWKVAHSVRAQCRNFYSRTYD